ncbi:MAG: type II secretion system F family protein [Acidimicrobiia bacterium]
MTRLAVVAALLCWIGTTFVLADRRWFARRALTDRLAPYHHSSGRRATTAGSFSVTSIRDVLGPLVSDLGARLSSALGVTEPLSDRLQRVHSPTDVTGFRLRQAGVSVLVLAATAAGCLTIGVDPVVGSLLVVLAPLVGFMLVEQELAHRVHQRSERVQLELPIVAEQLGMLLASGWSLGAAMARLAERGNGAVAQDLRWVCQRIRHGVGETVALREWSDRSRIDAVQRLVTVLSLNRETTDLGRMISDEARAMRSESHRTLLGLLDKRAQMVWIPVTVATLVPGVIFLSIPFIEVMNVFSSR